MDIKKTSKIIGKIFLWILGIWMGFLLIIQIAMLPPILTPIVNNLANKYVDADISIGRAYGSVITHFPRITLSIDDLDITYPHERYDSIARASSKNALVYHGCGETMDTLASIKRLSASVSLMSLLWGEVKIPDIEIRSPKLYAHSYDSEHANWNIFGSSESTAPADTTSAPKTESSSGGGSSDEGMNIIVKRISITGKPTIVYTDSQDSLFVKVDLNSLGFDGNFETNALHKTMAKAHIRELQINGKYGADTLAGKIQKFTLAPHKKHMDLNFVAQAYSELEEGLMVPLPFKLKCDLSIPKDEGIAVSMHNIETSIMTVPGEGDIEVKMRNDSTVINAQLDINEHSIQELLNSYLSHYMPEMAGMSTDTKVTVHAKVNGAINDINGTLPTVEVDLDIPDSKIDHESFPQRINLGMTANLQMDKFGQIYADLTRAKVKTYGLDLISSAKTKPLADDDHEIQIDGKMRMSLDSLRAFLPDTLNLIAKGGLNVELNGSTRMSYLDMYQFSQSELQGGMFSDNLTFAMPEDSINLNITGMDIRLLPEQFTSRMNPNEQIKFMGLHGSLGSADISYADAFAFSGKKLEFTAKNSTDNDDDADAVRFLGGGINAGLLYIEDSEGTSIKFDDTKNTFSMRPDRKNPTTPILSLSNKNLRITYVTPDNRVILTDSKIKAKAAMNTFDRQARRTAMLDSLAKTYPDIPRDSLFYHVRSQRASAPLPSWMAEDDFKSSDIKLDINESVKKYFREWDMSGEVGIRTGIIMTPYMPLRNIIRGISLSFTNDKAAVDSIKIVSGESELCAKGSVSNIKRAMLRNGTVKLGMEITSSSVNADELLNAYSIGSRYEPKTTTSTTKTEEVSNAEFFKQVTTDTVKTVQTSSSSLVVIPRNVAADIGIDMTGIRYQDLDISRMMTQITVKERCAQILGTTFESNVGSAYLDAFYAVRSKEDIRTGFCLELKDVTSERVISLMPEISKVMPMIESIQGQLNCEVAITAELDTTMNLKMPTVNGIARLGGKNLSITDDEVYTSVAKKLMFKNKRTGKIKDLMVEGTIRDNSLEIFPFILAVDRYTLGLGGVQNVDMSYKHHISVLRSPLLIRLGLDLYGSDYDHMHFRLGRAKYRPKKIPSFTAVIDQTKNDLKYSIYNIFETGVDKTIEQNNMQTFIKQHEDEIGYVNAALIEMEELSEEEMQQFEESGSTDALVEETMAAAVAAVQEVLKNK